ncbi:uncharacterized protein TRIADDRAFT_57326 [Trichoplax adhaerens]|uniref:Tr-type G domain-containing protein n=1 Tax=Trichoplax adhaerens TaxID=10228 RepID=B3RZ49_TRIAD|nr:hypothetical protein TRIADDRAFT_57326 [Trichoplax adhaerens]EDV23780.1 hypothetical protein TRIADDRAFT_57326 [Trichoplax adhaerens]|eukprot:XP_002113306.1 hypothetical protein TRIADDRAFT_57326 [Trichoplax adhaerens]
MELKNLEITSSPTADLPPEIEEGNVEYKLKLIDVSSERFEQLVTQMKWRLEEGYGEAIYKVGVSNGGCLIGLQEKDLERSLCTLKSMASSLDADLTILRYYAARNQAQDSSKRVAEVLVRRVSGKKELLHLKIAVLGDCGVGKSTLLGVLTTNELDNGQGKARLNLFKHLHEIESGLTSSVSHEVLGFDSKGNVMNYSDSRTAEDIMLISSKLLTLIDLAGHQKYFKTTILGLVGHAPHCFMFVVNARTGLGSETAKIQLRLAAALKIPLFVVINKIDACSAKILHQTTDQVNQSLQAICDHRSYLITNSGEVIIAASNFSNNSSLRSTPVFQVSCTKGNGLDLVKQFLNLIPMPCGDIQVRSEKKNYIEFQVNEIYYVPNVGVVVGGLLSRGTIHENNCLWLGPCENGDFDYVKICSIHRNRLPCQKVQAGQMASLAINNVNKEKLRKGMVLIDQNSTQPCSCQTFEASVTWLSSEKVVNKGSQVCVFIRNIRQSAVVERITMEGDDVRIRFRLKKQPEYIIEGNRIIFRQGDIIGLGIVKSIVPLPASAIT